jgi:hypothetical protein
MISTTQFVPNSNYESVNTFFGRELSNQKNGKKTPEILSPTRYYVTFPNFRGWRRIKRKCAPRAFLKPRFARFFD